MCIAIIIILIIIVANILILYKCGVFELYDLKKTYNEALNEGSVVRIYKSGDTITAVLDENNDTAEDVDISNKELDGYIESIKDDERRNLMKDYLFLPSVPQYRIQEISDLTLMERAKYLAEMPIEDLRVAVEVIRDHVDDSLRIQNEDQNQD